MNKYYIIKLLNEIILQLQDIKDDEDSCNEGSLTDYEFDKILNKFNLIFKELFENE